MAYTYDNNNNNRKIKIVRLKLQEYRYFRLRYFMVKMLKIVRTNKRRQMDDLYENKWIENRNHYHY